jgi:hypothetical protein
MIFTPVVSPDSMRTILPFGVAILSPRELVAAFTTEAEALAYCDFRNRGNSLISLGGVTPLKQRVDVTVEKSEIVVPEKPAGTDKLENGLKELKMKPVDFGKL